MGEIKSQIINEQNARLLLLSSLPILKDGRNTKDKVNLTDKRKTVSILTHPEGRVQCYGENHLCFQIFI